MNKKKLLSDLGEIVRQQANLREEDNMYRWHRKADLLLLEYINDEEVTEAFEEIDKWYC